jgi:phage FluMu protein Com
VTGAWRCSNCNKLMYNLDPQGYPAPGSPQPKYLGSFAQPCCSVCFDLGTVILDSTYFLGLHNKHKAIAQRILGGNPTA